MGGQGYVMDPSRRGGGGGVVRYRESARELASESVSARDWA